MEPGKGDDEQVAVRHADASGGDTRANQHEEDRIRYIQFGKRGSEAAGEEQPDNLRRTVRFGQEASSASSSSDPTFALEYPVSGETQCRPGYVLVQKSRHVDDDEQISALESILRDGWTREPSHRRSVGGIEEKMQEISRDVNYVNWLTI